VGQVDSCWSQMDPTILWVR